MRMKHLSIATLAAAVAATLGPVVPAVAVQPSTDPRTISYHGYRAAIPAGWRVVDLTRDPTACLRLDRPAVYLGHPGDQSACPARVTEPTAGLLVEPLDATVRDRITDDVGLAVGAAAPPSVVSRNGTILVAVEAAGVLVTALHAPDTEPVVRRILETASLTAGGVPAPLPERSGARAAAVDTPQPGTFLGRGFDACSAPSQSAMNAWLASPYRAVGVYISGGLRACAQPNLTATWVTNQVAQGWRIISIDVGRQAPCTSYRSRISADPAIARTEGREAADGSVQAARALGIPAGSAIYSDIEAYSSTASCRAAVLSYLSGWTEQLHALGYLSGFYSSAASGIRDAANAYDDPAYTRVDHIWFAWWNGRADTDTGTYAPATVWANHQRIHQYSGEVDETWGGVRLNIDGNYLDVAAGTPEPPGACAAVNLDFPAYPALTGGATGDAVRAVQCLLDNAGFSPGEDYPTGDYDESTSAAVRAFQQTVGLGPSSDTDSHTWTALLAFGDMPTLRNGSTGAAVRRLQRALTAALSRTVGIDGQFGAITDRAVRDYQTTRGLGVDGVVGPQTWAALQGGR
jgi:peptidoglycan hydrolase-like protein with peptidoglycan-binding domain